MEELHPFPYKRMMPILEQYKNAEVFWCQEEHKNQGAWGYVRPRLNNVLRKHNKPEVRYIGRTADASTASGYGKVHSETLQKFLTEAMS